MKLRRIGFFCELPHGDANGPVLRDAIRRQAEADEPSIIEYLSNGELLVATPGMADDVISGRKHIAAPHLLTDGTYVWPMDLSYYVANYHAALPDEFLRHGRAANWRLGSHVGDYLDTLEL